MKRSRWLPITWMAVLAALVLIGGMASSAWAAILFEDDFNRATGNTVGNGWVEIERNGNDVGIAEILSNNRLQLRDRRNNGPPDAAAIQENISTMGYTDISVMYDWAPRNNTESNDIVFVEWKLPGDSDWTELAKHELGGSLAFSSNTVPLGPGAADQPAIQFRFATDVSASSEAAYIDNVKLIGTGTGPAATAPEPGTLLLIASGLVGLGVGARRRSSRK